MELERKQDSNLKEQNFHCTPRDQTSSENTLC